MAIDKFKQLEAVLLQSFEDYKLTSAEKYTLIEVLESCSEEERRFLRNKAFDLFRRHLAENEMSVPAYNWLEKTVKALEYSLTKYGAPEAHFSPGEDCRNKILHLIASSKKSIDICVFTISDNVLSEAILKTYARGISVRILTDNDKAHDKGSDIDRLARSGIAIREDNTRDHMHHKFAVFDKSTLLNGSFNWTRSATERNYENIAVNQHPKLVEAYQHKFDELWLAFEINQVN